MDEKLFETGEIEFAYDDDESFTAAAARIAKRFGVLVVMDSPNAITSMGWPMVHVVGEFADVVKCVTECWVSGDDEDDKMMHADAFARGRYIS